MVAMTPGGPVQNGGESGSGPAYHGVLAYLGLFMEQMHLGGVDVVRRQSLTQGFDGAPLLWMTPKCLA